MTTTRAPWLETYRRRHLRLMVVLTLAGSALFVFVSPPSSGLQLIVLAAAVAVVGLPHGALDHLSGRKLLEPLVGIGWLPLFLAGYVLLAATVFLSWGLAPRFMLTTFLLYSAWHFGVGDVDATAGGQRPNWLLAPVRGSLPLALPALFHGQEVTRYFNWLLPADQALSAPVVEAAAAKIVIASSALLVTAIALGLLDASDEQTSGVSFSDAAELLALSLLFAWAPPLISFLVYFCGWHSIRHLLELGAELDPGNPKAAAGQIVKLGWPLTLATLAAAYPVWRLMAGAGSGGEQALARVLFIGLAALTIPHMLLGSLAAWQDARHREDGREDDRGESALATLLRFETRGAEKA